ncbi:two-component system, OmpR family, sensor histidine kinase SaeS [Filimonas lacunae]|uniref:histidine kinase n=1 Tax=Filimonas lacunae TaxID=477680 RepID=A0A173MJU2_9BACT|nr:histidine kinase dimerization/phospho-acceptor domain-containing protein [Filimonas lacunae]BAV07905.1 hypothetical protein FLA_3936 [Filimonas lacunae]SIT06306.1 two-component system, OmpR family, sensor histidine kinase SaeS [Filimonas lacunae]
MCALSNKSDYTSKKNFIALQQLLHSREKEITQLKHDLRTPVTSIQLIAEFIINNSSDDINDHKEKLAIIIECCQQINTQLEHSPMHDIAL